MPVSKELWTYYLIRLLAFPFQWMPYSWIHAIGNRLGAILFYLMPTYRKRTFSNLSLAKELNLSKTDLMKIAKQSFQNLATVCLEYPRLSAEKHLSPSILCENPEEAEKLHKQGQGIIFFCAHLSNWEVLFLEGTSRMQGIAIGKPIKNKSLYRWILSIREKYGGRIVTQRNALLEGIRALKKGVFVGIVGDQGMPSSGYCSPFLGRNAWSSTAPALLAYRTNSPIIVAWTMRVHAGYRIRYSDPIWPDQSLPIETEIPRMMTESFAILQNKIKERPGEWLWQHNRWKQQTPKNIYKQFRHDSICIILPEDTAALNTLLPHLQTFREIYPLDFLFLCAPNNCRQSLLFEADEIFFYSNVCETLLPDYRCKLIFNLTNKKRIRKHYLSLSAFEVLDLKTLKTLSEPHLPPHLANDFSAILKRALCRPGSLWKKEETENAC